MSKSTKELLKTTKRLTLCALFSALGTVILWLGSALGVMDLSAVAVAAVLNVLIVIEYGKGWPWAVYAVTGLLALLFLPDKNGAVMYIVLGGYYPMIKEKLERLKPWLSWVLKFVIFNAAFAVVELVSFYILNVPLESTWMQVAIAVLGNLAFGLFDYVLTKLITLYVRKLRIKFKFLR